MKITTSRKELLTAAQFAAFVVKSPTTLPALSHLLIRPEASRDGCGVNLVASNLELQSSHWCATEDACNDSDGFLIPAKLFIETLSLSDAEEVDIVYDGNKAHITLGARKLNLATMPAVELPLFPEVKGESFDIASEVLGTQLSRVSFAMLNDKYSDTLNNVSVAFVNNTLRFIATNRRRGAMTSIPFKGSGEFLMPPLLTSSVEKSCKKSDCDVVVTRSKNAASFKFKDSEIIGKLHDGHFPNFEQVIPLERPHRCEVERQTLINALRALKMITTNTHSGIRFEFGSDSIILMAGTPENSSEEIIPSSKCEAEPVAFQAENILPALEHMTSDKITIEPTGSHSPIVIQEHDYINVIMPMRLS